ncbi:MAG: VPLPA-CTERM sorting domain-containing protein [Pseudomonadota bacterium]
MSFLKKIAAIATATVLSSSAAFAVTLDFTTGALPFSGTELGGWTLTFVPDAPDVSETGPGLLPLANGDTLAGTTDGVGILGDELDGGGMQYAVLTFVEEVFLTNVYGLDHFANATVNDQEEMRVTVGAVPGAIDASLMATDTGGIGFSDLVTSLRGTTFTFWAGEGNDGAGKPDFALAGVTVAPIPLPASALLLLGAVGGLGAMRRRAKRA